jgi:hypothetical protein
MSEVLEAEFEEVKPKEAAPLEVTGAAILEAVPGGLIAIEQLGCTASTRKSWTA